MGGDLAGLAAGKVKHRRYAFPSGTSADLHRSEKVQALGRYQSEAFIGLAAVLAP